MTWTQHVDYKRAAMEFMGLRPTVVSLGFEWLEAPAAKAIKCRRAPAPPAAYPPRQQTKATLGPGHGVRHCSVCKSLDHDVRWHRNGYADGPCRVCGKDGCAPPNHSLVEKVRADARYSRIVPPGRLTPGELAAKSESPEWQEAERPKTRGECGTERPCPFVSCSRHLYLDVDRDTGAIRLNFPKLEVWEMTESCSLDVADRGGMTQRSVAHVMKLSRQRIQQIEELGLKRMKDAGGLPGPG